MKYLFGDWSKTILCGCALVLLSACSTLGPVGSSVEADLSGTYKVVGFSDPTLRLTSITFAINHTGTGVSSGSIQLDDLYKADDAVLDGLYGSQTWVYAHCGTPDTSTKSRIIGSKQASNVEMLRCGTTSFLEGSKNPIIFIIKSIDGRPFNFTPWLPFSDFRHYPAIQVDTGRLLIINWSNNYQAEYILSKSALHDSIP